MKRPQNSTPSTPTTRAKNGRKRTAVLGLKPSGTKAKQTARATARKAAHVKRHGATAPALRATHDTLPRFAPGQKRRRADDIGERFTASILSVFRAARNGGMPEKLEAPSGSRTAPPKLKRDRTLMRESGMRFERDADGRGEWTYVDGTHGSPIKIGYGRVTQRRQLRQTMHALDRDIEKLAEIGESVSRSAVGLE